jgi:hypothetical protein
MGLEPMMRVLQTLALPTWPRRQALINTRAGNETRTRDLLLGKEVFYQLNYARMNQPILLSTLVIIDEFFRIVNL